MKLSIPKLLDTSKLLGTQAGQQLEELVTYCAITMSQIISCLRSGLTYSDNFDCLIQTVKLTHNQSQVINRGAATKTITNVVAMQTISTTTSVSSMVWYLNNTNQLVIVPQFFGAPTATVTVTLRIEY